MASERILVVEDDRPIAELLKYRLITEGFETEIAETGSKALKLARSMQPDLILLDWQLPDISGLDVCQQVTQTMRIPIIMVTARNMVEDKVLGLRPARTTTSPSPSTCARWWPASRRPSAAWRAPIPPPRRARTCGCTSRA